MRKGWEEKMLDEVCEVEYGTRVVNKKDGGTIYPVYGGGGATFFMDTFNRENCFVIARFAMSQQCTKFVEGKFFLNDSGLSVKPKNAKEIIQEFLNLQLLYLNDHIYSLARGTAQKNLDVPAFRSIEIHFPKSLFEQQRIVDILDETFAAIDKAKANVEKNLQNAKELFDSYLQGVVENGNWEKKELREITTILGDGLHGTPKYTVDGEYYFINGNNLNDGRIEFKESTKRVNVDEFNKHKKNLTDRTVFVSINGTLGNVAFYNGEKIILGKSACYFNIKENVDKSFVKYVLSSPYFINYAHREATGATIKNVSLKTMREFKVPLPSLKEQQSIVRHLDSLRANTQKLENLYQRRIEYLDELRKSILQKAFAGELTTSKHVHSIG